MWWCVTAVNRMLQPAKSPWSANPACVKTTLKTATRSTQSQPQKVNVAPTTAMAATPATTATTPATTTTPAATATTAATAITPLRPSFPRVNRNCFQELEPIQRGEMMSEDEMMRNVLQH